MSLLTQHKYDVNGYFYNIYCYHIKYSKGVLKTSLKKYSEIFHFGHFKNVHFRFSWRTFFRDFLKKPVVSIMQ